MAGDNIIINCDPSVEPGVIIMTNPPKISCDDLDLINIFVGTGLKFGPITDMNQLKKQIAELQPPVLLDPAPKTYHFGPSVQNPQEKTKFEVRRDLAFQELSELNAALRSVPPGYLDDFSGTGTVNLNEILINDPRPQITSDEPTEDGLDE
jgi:hypothetical protein